MRDRTAASDFKAPACRAEWSSGRRDISTNILYPVMWLCLYIYYLLILFTTLCFLSLQDITTKLPVVIVLILVAVANMVLVWLAAVAQKYCESCSLITVSYLNALFTILHHPLSPGYSTPVKSTRVQTKPAHLWVNEQNTSITMESNPAYITTRGEKREWHVVGK